MRGAAARRTGGHLRVRRAQTPVTALGREARPGTGPARPDPRAVLLRAARPLRQRRHLQRPGQAHGFAAGDRFDPADKGFYQGGDLKGLTQRLDYIKGLGTTAIWLAPIFKNRPVQGTGDDASAGYHGYWITDFTQVDPHFGTNADLTKLIDKAHGKGMKVFFDVITNHTADTVDHAEKEYGYRSKGAYPYLDKDGRPFDDTRGVGKVDADSFPYTPQNTGKKVPAWLNDTTMYHNRGDSTYAGESTEYGDFSGLDDLWTERPEVVSGMEKIYEKWVRDFDIDGFRIDTVKHVDLDFWTQWATALDGYAAKHGRDDFFMFGEVYSADTAITSPYVTRGRLDATLDFPFQEAARQYASQGAPASKLAAVYGDDYRYTTDKANAYEQVTFLGNHDMGRIGTFLKQDNPKAGDAELLDRARLANELMFLGRGNPVIYYGDEQGYTGAGGDKDARQPLFASKTADYLDDDQLGTDRTHASDAYDTTHPLYRSIAALSKLTADHPALRDGVQTERYAKDSVYAFSRTDTKRRTSTSSPPTTPPRRGPSSSPPSPPGMNFRTLYGGSGTLRSGSDKTVKVTVPALSSIVLRADKPLGTPATKPSVTLKAPAAGATGTVELTADVKGGGTDRVVFAAQTGNGAWVTLGSADHAPYKVTQHLDGSVKAGTPLRYKAVVVDRAGRTASALAAGDRGPGPARPEARRRRTRPGDRPLPAVRRRLRGLAAEVRREERRLHRPRRLRRVRLDRPRRGHLLGPVHHREERHGRRPGAHRRPGAATGQVWVEQGKDGQTIEAPETPPQDTSKAVLHYHRADGNYDGWGLHTWTGAAAPTDWAKPLEPVRTDAYGVTFEVPLTDGATSLSYILHKGDEKDLPSDQSLDIASYGHEVWMLGGKSGYLLPQAGGAPTPDLTKAEAQWIDADTVVWKVKATAATSQQLVYARNGGISVVDGALSDEGRWLRLGATELTDAQKAKYPHLTDYPAFTVDPRDRDRVRESLRGQLIATQRAANGALLAATGVQTAGVLDDAVREGRERRRPRAGLPEGHPDALRLGAHRPHRLPRTRREERPDAARRPHRRLVGHREEVLDRQALPVRRPGLGPHRPEDGHQQGHRPLLHRPHHRLRPQPRRRPRRPGARPARLVRAEEARRRAAAGRPDPGAAHP